MSEAVTSAVTGAPPAGPAPGGQPSAPPAGAWGDPDWFKRAVFYEVLVRGFADSNDDGVGDFPGLIEHLDYLRWLGVDCLWLLPFYASPLRDGGYDITDYHPCSPPTAPWRTCASWSPGRTRWECEW